MNNDVRYIGSFNGRYLVSSVGEIFNARTNKRVMVNGRTGTVKLFDNRGAIKHHTIRDLMVEVGFINPLILDNKDMFITLPPEIYDDVLFQMEEGSIYYIYNKLFGPLRVYSIYGNKLTELSSRDYTFSLSQKGKTKLFTAQEIRTKCKKFHGDYNMVKLKIGEEIFYVDGVGAIYKDKNLEEVYLYPDSLTDIVTFKINGKEHKINTFKHFKENKNEK